MENSWLPRRRPGFWWIDGSSSAKDRAGHAAAVAGVSVARLAPRRSCPGRQVYDEIGVSVLKAIRSRLRRNAQAGSRAWRRSHQAADRTAATPLSQETQYPNLRPARK